LYPGNEFTSKLDESRRVTLHVITDPGQSKDIETSFRGLMHRLDPALDVICVSESSKMRKNAALNEIEVMTQPLLFVLL